MPEVVLLVLGLAVAGTWVLTPLFRSGSERASDGDHDQREAAALHHRVALEALRDVEADRRAGSLDDAAYAEQLAEAEERAAATLAGHGERPTGVGAPSTWANARRVGLAAAGVIGVVLLAGSLLPVTGIANQTVVNEVLADARAAEDARQERIAELLGRLDAADPDPSVLSELADAYLAGSSADDLVRAAVALQAVIELDPDRADAYERIVSAYLRAGDAANARAALTAYAERPIADPVEVAFLDGLVALRLENDPEAALAAFDSFLELAPDDPRAGMVRGLREQAASAEP